MKMIKKIKMLVLFVGGFTLLMSTIYYGIPTLHNLIVRLNIPMPIFFGVLVGFSIWITWLVSEN